MSIGKGDMSKTFGRRKCFSSLKSALGLEFELRIAVERHVTMN